MCPCPKWGPMAVARTRIAILGGGPAALTAACSLTSTEQLRERYDITLYQMGWRLGGKGRSGRGKDGRIEEHGLHILFGFYQNFFSLIRDCYEELDRPPEHPFSTWRKAFHPYSFGLVEDWFQGRWHHWPIEFPGNHGLPGSGTGHNSGGDYLGLLLHTLLELLSGWRTERGLGDELFVRGGPEWEAAEDTPPASSGREDAGSRRVVRLLRAALRLAGSASQRVEQRAPWVLPLLQRIRRRVLGELRQRTQSGVYAFRFYSGVDFFLTLLIGMVVDRLHEPGALHALDAYDLREWLRKHGADEETLQSSFVRTVYGAAFSYVGGDPRQQQVAAGAALRALFRVSCTYKGAIYYKMRSGMGDVVFAPLYQVLQRRGVKFQFFHKVESLHLTPERDAIASVRMTRQAELKEPGREYEPLVDVGGLECWPSEPRWEQLRDAERLQAYDLESYYTPWKGVGGVELRAGEDFDQVLLATPVGCIPFLCQELLAHSQRWRDMVRHVKSVQTLSVQLWLERDLSELGWDMPSPLLSLFAEPLNTWAEMSQVLETEPWPEGHQPRSVQYFTGPQEGPDLAPPPEDEGFPARQRERARQEALQFLRNHLTTLLPKAVDRGAPPQFDWNLLVDPEQRRGEARLEAQYYRSNCEPADRCTVALPGATRYRMKAGDTGYRNLFITGDWIDNGLYLACMEGAVQGGILAARALSGVAFPLIGEEMSWTGEDVPSPAPVIPLRAFSRPGARPRATRPGRRPG